MGPLSLTRDYVDGLNREWERLASPGTWWTGAERVQIAAVARAAREQQGRPDTSLPEAAVAAAARLSANPRVDAAWFAGVQAMGMHAEAYVELLAVVSRLSAVDSFMFGIATDNPQPLPDPGPGEPSRTVTSEARLNGALAPTIGKPGAPNALSAVPAEQEATFDLHGVLYLSLEEMGDPTIVKDLSRAQMELLAARTSLLNDCFY